MNIYLISGLGADERAFHSIHLPGHHVIAVKWVKPNRTDTMESYAKKLLSQFSVNEPLVLIGVSFGGIIAQELAQLIPVKKLIVISSVKSPVEFDWRLKLLNYIPLHKLLSAGMLKSLNLITANYFFSTKSKAESRLLRSIINDTDNEFMLWAIRAAITWTPSYISNAIHIHGTSDRILPVKNIRNFIPVKSGGHFMILSRAKEISRKILDIL